MGDLRDVGFVNSLSGLRGGLRSKPLSYLTGKANLADSPMSPASIHSFSPGSLDGTSHLIGIEENLQDIMSTPWHSSPSDSPVQDTTTQKPNSSICDPSLRPLTATTTTKNRMVVESHTPNSDSFLVYTKDEAEASRNGLDVSGIYKQQPYQGSKEVPEGLFRSQSAKIAMPSSGIVRARGWTYGEEQKDHFHNAVKVMHSPVHARNITGDDDIQNMSSGNPSTSSWEHGCERAGESAALRAEVARLNEQYKDALEAIEKAHQQVEEHGMHSAKLERRVKVMEGDAENHFEKLARTEQALLDSQENLSKAEADLKALGNQLTIANQQNQSLERDGKAWQEEVEKERIKCQLLEDKLVTTKDEVKALQKELSSEHEKQQVWTVDERKLTTMMQSSRKENQKLMNALEAKEQELVSLRESRKGALRDAEGVSKTLQQAQFENVTLARENNAQKRKIADLESLVSKLEDSISLSRDELAELKYKCRELEGSTLKNLEPFHQPRPQSHQHQPSHSIQPSRISFPWQNLDSSRKSADRDMNPLCPLYSYTSAQRGIQNYPVLDPRQDGAITKEYNQRLHPGPGRDALTEQLENERLQAGRIQQEVEKERSLAPKEYSWYNSTGDARGQHHVAQDEVHDPRNEPITGKGLDLQPENQNPPSSNRHISPIVGAEWGAPDTALYYQPRGKKVQTQQYTTRMEQSVKESMVRTKVLEDHLIALGLEKNQLECEHAKMPPHGGRTLNAITRKQLVEGRLEEIGREISHIRLELKMLATR